MSENRSAVTVRAGALRSTDSPKAVSSSRHGDGVCSVTELVVLQRGTAYTWDDLASVVALSAETPRLAVTPAPRGKPGGPGLYDVESLAHSPYLQQIVKALIEKRGMPPGRAYAVAYGALRKWRRGGGKVHPEVRAAATGALADEAAKGAMAKAMHGHANTWDDVALVIDMAAAASNGSQQAAAGQPRVPPGQPAAGQFTSPAAAAPPAKAKTAAPAKPAAKPQQSPAQQKAARKAGLLKQAAGDRAKAAGILKQITALQKVIAAAQAGTGKTVSAASNVTKTTAGSTTAASPSTKAAASSASSAAAGKTAGATASATASASSASKALPQLQAQYKTLMTQAAQATAAAAKL